MYHPNTSLPRAARYLRSRFLPLILLVSLIKTPAHLNGATSGIFVDPDIRVSYDGGVVHMEAYVAASASRPNVLIAGAELAIPGRNMLATEAQLYRSTDAGVRWEPIPLPDEVTGGWDNAIAGGIDDSGYFLTHNFDRGLTLYHTIDGRIWKSTVLKPQAAGWDRPEIAIDLSVGARHGTLYVAGEARDGVRVIRSSDGGNTFSQPVLACPKRPDWNAATSPSPLVLRDGTLILPCLPYPNSPQRATWTDGEVGLVESTDGGQTFTPFRKIVTVHRLPQRAGSRARINGNIAQSGNFMQGPVFAVAPPENSFADRIYAVWQDISGSGSSRLRFAFSADKGQTWSTAIAVDPSTERIANPPVQQAVPMIAVNKSGVVGVAWFDDRLVPKRGYDVYFTASLDGGATFQAPVRVSTHSSRPEHGLNIIPAFAVSNSADGQTSVTMSSPFATRATGADNSSMAVDAAGRFHPFWVDSRTDAWQLYTATIRVHTEPVLTDLTAKTHSCSLQDRQLELLFGEPSWNSSTDEVAVPVQLRNNSSDLIFEPIAIRITAKAPAVGPDAEPKIWNPSRRALEKQSTLVYRISRAAPLFPGGVTVPLTWRIRLDSAKFLTTSLEASLAGNNCRNK